jgi:hypothetical protein
MGSRCCWLEGPRRSRTDRPSTAQTRITQVVPPSRPIASELDERVLGISAAEFIAIPRRVSVAGGQRKWSSIRAALVGGWLNVLVTDLHTARWLASTSGTTTR